MNQLPKEIERMYSRRSRKVQIEKWRSSLEKGTEISYSYGDVKGKLTLENVDTVGRELLNVMHKNEVKVYISYTGK